MALRSTSCFLLFHRLHQSMLCSVRSGVDCLGSEGSGNGGVQHLGVGVAADDDLGGLNS